ncbi:MAG: cell division protein FtsA, partial [Candidatus Marinamargulisbacteria bacterium]
MSLDSNLIVGLDVGSSKICVAICEMDADGDINLKSVATGVSAGITKGKITEKEELQLAIERTMRRVESEIGGRPNRVIASIPYSGIEFVHNIGLVMSKEETGQISKSDQTECIKRSRNIIRSPNQKLLHVIPLGYKVDGTLVKNPVGV